MSDDDADRPDGYTVRFHPGEGVAVIADHVLCLVFDEPTSHLVQVLRSRLVGPVGADVALDAMVRAGGLDLPPFGLVALEGGRARVVVRGAVHALVDTSDERTELAGELVSTWVEHVADGVRSIELTAAGSTDRGVPVFETGAGVVPAETVVVAVADADGSPLDRADVGVDEDGVEASTGDLSDGDERHADVSLGAAFAAPPDAGPHDEPDRPSFVEQIEPLVHDASELTRYEPYRGDPEEPVSEGSRDLEHGSEEAVVDAVSESAGQLVDAVELPVPPPFEGPSPTPVSPVEVDHGATLIGPFEDLDAAVAPGQAEELATPESDGSGIDAPGAPVHEAAHSTSASDDVESAADDYDHLFGATQFRTVEQAAVRPDEEQSAPADGLIAQIPSGDATISPATDGIDGDLGGDHDGHTVSMASLRAQLQRSTPAPGTSPSVHAVHCPLGHLNPTHAGTCRVCGAAIEDQEHVSVPRPVLGTLTFADGRVVSVMRPLVIGRSPAAEGQLSGEPPELVVVTSPLKEVSSTHLEVRLEGWQVLVVDRQSTNGTVITPPGRDPQRLRPGEAVPITPGTRVNLADEVEFVFEASQ